MFLLAFLASPSIVKVNNKKISCG